MTVDVTVGVAGAARGERVTEDTPAGFGSANGAPPQATRAIDARQEISHLMFLYIRPLYRLVSASQLPLPPLVGMPPVA